MEETKISTGVVCFDWLLEGGFEKGVITTIYGPAGAGKTNLCLLLAKDITDGKIIYVDTEGSFSVSRFRQICDDLKLSMENIIFLNPTTFEEQKKAFKELTNLINKNISVIIIDSIAMLYRLEIGKTKNIYDVNRALGTQLGQLNEIARKNNIPILVTNQVYSDFEEKGKINIVGGDLLKYQSKCLIELQKTDNGFRKAIIRKHRSIEDGKEIIFKITDRGIEEAKLEKY